MLKYTTTKGAYGKGANLNGNCLTTLMTSTGTTNKVSNSNDNNNCNNNKIIVCQSTTDRNSVVCSTPSKLPSLTTSSNNGNQICTPKWNGSSSKMGFPSNDQHNSQSTVNPLDIVKIYTDWANHYLEKRNKRLIQDLQKDMQDSLLLIDVIESVIGEKVPNVKRKPKNAAQIVENIGYCLQYLSSLGVSLDGIFAKDIKDGQLKSILGLFYSLSLYKQRQKTTAKIASTAAVVNNIADCANNGEMLSKLPSPLRNGSSGSNNTIHQASANGANGVNNNNDVRPNGSALHSDTTTRSSSTSTQQFCKSSCESNNSSTAAVVNKTTKSSSASASNNPAKDGTAKSLSSGGKSLGLKPPSAVKVPTGTKNTTSSANSNNSTTTSTTSSNNNNASGNNGGVGQTVAAVTGSNLPAPKDARMLDKFKLFGSKDKSQDKTSAATAAAAASASSAGGSNSPRLSKSSTRASNSSSGFSSGRSELSDVSSTSCEPLQTAVVASKALNSPKPSIKSLTKKSLAVTAKGSLLSSSSTTPATTANSTSSLSPKLSKKELLKTYKMPCNGGANGEQQLESTTNNIQQQTSPQLTKKQQQQKLMAPSNSANLQDAVGGNHHSDSPGVGNSSNNNKIPPPPASKLKPPLVTSPTTTSCSQIPGFGGAKNGATATAGAAAMSGSIPKPTLAVKGMKPVSTGNNCTTSNNNNNNNNNKTIVGDESIPSSSSGNRSVTTNSNNLSNGVNNDSVVVVGMSSNKSVEQLASVSSEREKFLQNYKAQRSYSNVAMKTSTNHHPSSPVTVGVVSPITHHKKLPLAAGGNADLNSSVDSQTGGHQSDSNSSHTSGNQSDTASVIYCPSADEMSDHASTGQIPGNLLRRNKSKSPGSATEENMQKLRELSSSPARTQSRLETTFDSNEGVVVTQTVCLDDEPAGLTGAEEEASNAIQPMQPLIHRASPYAYLRGLGSLTAGKSLTPSTTSADVQSNSRNARTKNPRLLFNKPLASLLHTDAEDRTDDAAVENEAQLMQQDSGDERAVKCAAGEVAAGYVSEGGGGTSSALPLSDQIDLDISGYMSEGGISLYARKLQARFREGLELAVRGSMRKTNDVIDDSFEDSSSLSSGISETIDEISTDDLTGSSLSDQAFNVYAAGSLQRNVRNGTGNKQYSSERKSTESGQQTEQRSSGAQQQQQQHHHHHHYGGGNVRKFSDQYDPQRIDSLLQKCRTSTRGLHASTTNGGGGGGQQPRPKSEQMNATMATSQQQQLSMSLSNQRRVGGVGGRVGDCPEIELSADGQTLHVSNFNYRRIAPLTVNNLHTLKQQQNGSIGNGSTDLYTSLSRTSAGYHSLDRKKHLLGYGNGDNLKYCSESDALYVNYPPLRSNAGAALALVSPRRVPSLKKGGGVVVSTATSADGSAAMASNDKDAQDQWARHGSGQPSMSRSMIEPEAKLSTCGQENRINGHARLSIPPQQNLSLAAALQQATNGILQGTSMQCRNPRVNNRNSTSSTQSESGMMRKDSNEITSPSSQLYLHKLITNVSTGALFGNGPSSPCSISAPPSSRISGHGHGCSPYLGNVMEKTGGLEEVHGSSLSLASSSSSVYSTTEEKYQSEIRKLHRDIDAYKEKIQTLTIQQSTYDHVMVAFEQSLQSMTKRVQSLTATSEQKDCELTELKEKFSIVREISAARGLNVDEILLASPNLQRRHTFNTNESPGLVRQLSSESMTSNVSQRSSLSTGSKNSKALSVGGAADKKGKKSWLRSSFTKAFSKQKKNKNGSMSDVEENQLASDTSNPASPLHTPRNSAQIKPAGSSSALNETALDQNLHLLKMQLMDKDSALTDVRLDALTRAHEVDELKEIMNYMKLKISSLEMDNQRLQTLVKHSSRAPSQSSLPLMSDDTESVSEGGIVLSDMSVPVSVDASLGDNREGYRVTLTVNFDVVGELSLEANCPCVLIGSLCLSYKTKWDLLDTIVSKLFKEYVLRIDQVSNLGLSAESILGYSLVNMSRLLMEPVPQALPCSYLNENRTNIIRVSLRGCNQNAVDGLAFETLIPKSIVQRYVSLLLEHRRVIISGSCGTGKTYLARKLAEYVVIKSGSCVSASSVITFNIENQVIATEAKRYLAKLADQLQQMQSSKQSEPPVVIILDNLHNVSSLSDMFASLLGISVASFPYIIGTTTQQPSSTTTNLQLHHNFRWVTCANHMEPVKGLLTRYLRRRQIEGEIERGSRYPAELVKVLDWLPKLWTQLNKFLETVNNSTEVTIGPRLFLSCPLDVDDSREWFVNLWNDRIIPYLSQAAREGIHLDGHNTVLDEPTDFVIQTWPWVEGDLPDMCLTKLRLDDIYGETYDLGKLSENIGKSYMSDSEADPLVMLMRLQEQAKKQRQKDMDFISLRQNGVESTL